MQAGAFNEALCLTFHVMPTLAVIVTNLIPAHAIYEMTP